jgi:hypothetical protein
LFGPSQKGTICSSEAITSCFLMFVFCLKTQKWHQIIQQMLQNHLATKIKFQQTMLKLCLIIRCLQDQLVLGHMGSDASATKWLNTFGCKKIKNLNISHQTCQEDWFVVLLPKWCYRNTP